MRRPAGVVAPRHPRTRGRGVHLEVGHPLPVPEVRLTQPGVDQHRLARSLSQRDRGVQCAPQIRRRSVEAGHDRAAIVRAMQEFRSGQRAGTVMDRIAKGFTDDEIQAIAAWFAAQK